MEPAAARNRSIATDIYAHYARGDAGPLFAALAEDAVWETEGTGLPWSGRFIGPAGVRQYFERLATACEMRGYAVERLLTDDEWVMALATVQVCFRATGRTAAFRKVDAIRMREGKIAEFREYYDSAAVAAALAGS